MLLRYFYDRRLAQASYMVGCAATGEALIIDPMRDIAPYLQAAADEGLKIAHVTETHIHADFVSGSRELAAATGARLYVSALGGADWQYAFAGERGVIPLHDGDAWLVGNIRVEVVHTPGHTPEHISFLITDTAAADRPIGMFTGDFLFVGDVGRPDLLEEAAGFVGTKEIGARQQFHSVQRVRSLPDYLQIWPGHGAGSACGKALGAIPSTTLGYEKLFNPAFQHADEDAFVSWLLDGQPEPPRYFAQMKRVNKQGPALLGTLDTPLQADRAALDAALRAGALVLDLRDRRAFAAAHIPGTLNIPADDNSFVTYAGWFVDYDAPLYVIVPSAERAPAVLDGLRSIGVDNIPAWFTADVVSGATEALALIDVDTLAARLQRNGLMILDVRGHAEHQQRHIAGARNIPLGYLPRHLHDLPRDRTIVTQCASGFRSQIAASLLLRHGFQQVINLDASAEAWTAALVTEQG
jgi:hydroxyacylglutathione hydrolase